MTADLNIFYPENNKKSDDKSDSWEQSSIVGINIV